MKKLGIITFHRALNYGAALQAYALKQVCGELGYETHIVDYTPSGEPDEGPHPLKTFLRSRNKKRAAFKLARRCLSIFWDKKRWREFKRFRESFFDESTPCRGAKEIAALGYDAYVSGSDQIWNFGITGGRLDPVFFGEIPGPSACAVYAASAQDTPFPLNWELALAEKLRASAIPISIREKKLADYAADLSGFRFPVVLDPTLLAGREAFSGLIGEKTPREPYILIYQIDSNPYSDISVRSLEKRFGCRAYTMTVPRLGSIRRRKGASGPEDFLGLLSRASFLVTNSFHGVAFSLLFHKQFYVYENGGVMGRIDDLLERLGLRDRKVGMTEDIRPENTIDFNAVDTALAALREESLSFLKDALAGKGERLPASAPAPASPVPFAAREKKDCSGCTACVELCPVRALSMESDEEGFLYPKVDESRCIRCGRCDRFCSFLPVPRREREALPKAYAVKHREEPVRLKSRSGGAFVAFSDVVLREGGVVYGAAMDEDGTVRHIRAETPGDRDRMKDAKYVQSDLRGVFRQVTEDLSAGRAVLFSGTPCQAAGLKELLKAEGIAADRLVVCDLVCHGAPSPKLWKDYLDYIRGKYRATVQKAVFRDKSLGWDTHCESFILSSGKKVISRDYTDLFYAHLMFRPSCSNCRFANVNRVSDITLGDFWGVERVDRNFDDNKGVSLVLVSSPKGEALFESASAQLETIACDVRRCIQPTLVRPSAPSPRREEFWECYRKNGFAQTLRKFVRPVSTLGRAKRSVKKLLYRLGLRAHP